jgi:ParB/RepB/Spo0J family partition protein
MGVRVDLCRPNGFNPNVMPPEEYAALKRDMQQVGPQGVGPILLSSGSDYYMGKPELAKQGGYIIIDGEHRWRIAKELGWREINCELRQITEEQAKAVCYRANREHGHIDPFKEAALFNTDVKAGLSQQQIADKYLVDATTVSHRLSLLKLSPEVTEEVKKMPRGKLTVSHLEPITSLQPPDQKLMLSQIKSAERSFRAPLSVRDVEESVERLKQQREMEGKLQSAISKAKYPKCPKCKMKPRRIDSKGLPWVECESGNYNHTWNINTGKLMWTPTPAERTKREKPEPQTLRSNHTVAEIHAAFAREIKRLYPQIEVRDVRISGKLNGQEFHIELGSSEYSMNVNMHHGRGEWTGFRAEKHDYRTGEKTTVHCGDAKLREKTKAFIEQVMSGQLIQEQKTDTRGAKHGDEERHC